MVGRVATVGAMTQPDASAPLVLVLHGCCSRLRGGMQHQHASVHVALSPIVSADAAQRGAAADFTTAAAAAGVRRRRLMLTGVAGSGQTGTSRFICGL